MTQPATYTCALQMSATGLQVVYCKHETVRLWLRHRHRRTGFAGASSTLRPRPFSQGRSSHLANEARSEDPNIKSPRCSNQERRRLRTIPYRLLLITHSCPPPGRRPSKQQPIKSTSALRQPSLLSRTGPDRYGKPSNATLCYTRGAQALSAQLSSPKNKIGGTS